MRLRTSRAAVAVATVVTTLVLAACSSSGSGDDASPSNGFDGVVTVGNIDAFTGVQADRATARRYGLEAGVAYVNSQGGVTIDGKRLELRLKQEDSRGDVAAATTFATGMVQDDGIKAIFGSGSSAAEIKAVSAVAAQAEAIQLISNSSLSAITKPGDGLFDYTFGTNVSTTDALPAFIRMIKSVQPGSSSVSLLFDEVTGAPLVPSIAKTSAEGGLEVRESLTYPAAATDFAAPLTTIRSSGADVLWFGANPELDATLIRQAGQLNAAKLYVSFDQDSIVPPTGIGAPFMSVGAGGVYTTYASPARKQFAELLAQLNPGKPAPQAGYTFFSAGSFAGVLMLKQAMEKAGSTDDGDAIRAALSNADVDLPGADRFAMDSVTHQVKPTIAISAHVVGPDGRRDLIEFTPDGSSIVARTAAPDA